MRAFEFLSEGFAGIPDYKTMPAYKLKKASKGKHKFFLPTDAPDVCGAYGQPAVTYSGGEINSHLRETEE